MNEQMYTTDTAVERLTREVAEAVESGGRFSRAEFSVDDVATVLEAAVQQPDREDLIDATAKVLCQRELRGQNRSFDEVVAPGRELWQRYLYEAETLLDDLASVGVALPIPETESDEWCREESCRYRNWRSGSMPTHRRGADCPTPPIPATGEAETLYLDRFTIDHAYFSGIEGKVTSAVLARKTWNGLGTPDSIRVTVAEVTL